MGKSEVEHKDLIESESVGVKGMMPIMSWICNFLLEQGERIVVNLWFDNKGLSACEKIGKTPVCKRTRYVNVRLIDITMGKKRSVKPNGVQVVTGEVTCEEFVSKCCINEFGGITNVED
jgi:hypothetical protein